jgi:hypothetical protein
MDDDGGDNADASRLGNKDKGCSEGLVLLPLVVLIVILVTSNSLINQLL